MCLAGCLLHCAHERFCPGRKVPKTGQVTRPLVMAQLVWALKNGGSDAGLGGHPSIQPQGLTTSGVTQFCIRPVRASVYAVI